MSAPVHASTDAAATAPRNGRASTSWSGRQRVAGLRRFAAAIPLLNVLGHFWLGFEGAWLYPLTALATAYTLEIALELFDARLDGRPARFLGGGESLIDFLLSAHISAMAVSMLLYSNARVAPIAFAAAVAIVSKFVLRVRVDGRPRHFMNPSNLGIVVTLLCFPWVGIAPPYQFTENLGPVGDRIMPLFVIALGTTLNVLFTRRWPLILGWLGGFVVQAGTRHLLLGQPVLATLAPMTGMAFLLFTFYMVTDPATTPASRRAQIGFGAAVAAAYGAFMALHVVFGLFFSLAVVCGARGAWLFALSWRTRAARATATSAAAQVHAAASPLPAGAASARLPELSLTPGE